MLKRILESVVLRKQIFSFLFLSLEYLKEKRVCFQGADPLHKIHLEWSPCLWNQIWLLWLLQEFQLDNLQEQLNIQNYFISSCVDTENNNKKKKNPETN